MKRRIERGKTQENVHMISACRSPSRSVCADVAVPWIPLATIVQRVREPVCWDGVDLRWRAQLSLAVE